MVQVLVDREDRTELPPTCAGVTPVATVIRSSSYLPRNFTAVANALGVHRKTLVNYCCAVHFPTPSALVSWCQLFLVGYYLGHGNATVAAIAQQLDFPSATALRNLLKRYTGDRPQDVRAAGGLVVVRNAFAHAVRSQSASADAHNVTRTG
jgi:AraC-like DNA-binding protein